MRVRDGGGAVGARGTAVVGRRHGDAPAGVTPAGARALVAVVARALGLERVVLLAQDTPESPLVPLAVHGAPEPPPLRAGAEPGGGPWSLILPLPAVGTAGLLLLARAGGAPLPPADRRLAEQLADCAAGVIGHARMVADRDDARKLLARADRLAALGTLAAGVAHEIRNPLVSVRTFIQLLPERLHDEEFRTGFRDLALGEIERICSLINDLLAFSRSAPVQREPTDLNDLVGQIARLLDAEARRCDVAVGCTLDPTLPLVVVDDAQVKQVLLNVILNAIQACDARGQVEIRTARSGPWCVVAVADTGPGVSPEHQAHMFEPFFTTKDAGSGLGLFIAHQIVGGHDGHITVESRPEGGALFTIHFPLAARGEDGRDEH